MQYMEKHRLRNILFYLDEIDAMFTSYLTELSMGDPMTQMERSVI